MRWLMVKRSSLAFTSVLIWKNHINGLTHWGWVTHICVSKLTIIGSDNGLSPGRRQAIIWNNAGLLLIEPLGTNFSEISIGIQTFSFKKMHLKMSSGKCRPFCLGLNVLIRPLHFSEIWIKTQSSSYNKWQFINIFKINPYQWNQEKLLEHFIARSEAISTDFNSLRLSDAYMRQ